MAYMYVHTPPLVVLPRMYYVSIHTAVAVSVSFFINMFVVCAFGAVSHLFSCIVFCL